LWYANTYSPELDCSDAISIYISFYFKEDVNSNNEFELYLKDNHDNWDNVVDLGGYSPGYSRSWFYPGAVLFVELINLVC